MLEEADMGMISKTVFVRLLGEGTDVWRPTVARQVDDASFTLLEPSDYDASDETWEFLPGDTVICERVVLNGITRLAARRKAR